MGATETPGRQFTETISQGTVTVTSPEIWTLGGVRVGGYLIMGEHGDLLTLPLLLGGTLKTLRTVINPLTIRMIAREEATFLEISTPSDTRHYFRGKEV